MKRENRRHCGTCNSQRKGDSCFKCGSPTEVPDVRWDYPRLPSVDMIRGLAREVGYAIGVHGSLQADLDLIAAPWTDDAVGNAALIDHICAGMTKQMGRKVIMLPGTLNRKPLGRYACNIQINGWYKLIDLSIMPRVTTKE